MQRGTDVRATGDGSRPIALCWARERIRDLELPQPSGSRQQRMSATAETHTELVALGEAYGLLSSATSYVAVSSSVVAAGLDAELRRVPVALTAGWGGTAARARASAFVAMSAPAPAAMDYSASASYADMADYDAAPARGSSRERRRALATPAARRSVRDEGSFELSDVRASLRMNETGPDASRGVDERARVTALLMTQTAGGRFPFSDALQAELGPVTLLLERWKADDAVVTVVVLHLLGQRYGAFADETRAARQKAEASMTAEEVKAAVRHARHILAVL